MAAKKKKMSQAQKAAAKTNARAASANKTARGDTVSRRFISAGTFLILAVLFTIVQFQKDGSLVKIFRDFLYGFIGKAGLVVLIPAFIYLFIIHAFSGKRPVLMRTLCVFGFALSAGGFAHLILNAVIDRQSALLCLYQGGIEGITGGVLCGGLAYCFTLLLGNVLTYIVYIACLLLTFGGSFGITVAGIARAVQKIPKPEKDDTEEQVDPSEVMVNHIAKRHSERRENRRIRKEQEYTEPEEVYEQTEIKNLPPVATPVKTKNENFDLFPSAENAPAPKTAGIFRPAMDDFDDLDGLPREPAEASAVPKRRTRKRTEPTNEELDDLSTQVEDEINEAQAKKPEDYCYPPLDLLTPARSSSDNGTEEMREYSKLLNETLESFHIEAHIINVTRGPSVTRYEVELEKGVRLNKLTNAADDIALSLGASGVRIAAIPGKISVVGIEVPNRSVTSVSLREVIDSEAFKCAESKSTFALGKDISGNAIVGNIAKLPHMLIAGTTGSGKSVCTNSIIVSILYKAKPEEVKLIMVDPKMVELGRYNEIPHLLIPVVTDPKKAAGALQWAVTEMLRRYKQMSDLGVRDLKSYNDIIASQKTDEKPLAQVVVIIDELADLMIVAKKEVEESICRIAQMGRAAGIHLVIATQRPSADVITGLMKANIPSRIAFSVASGMESRIILDTVGAEKLVGKGDMLFAPIGSGDPKRVQGCFVSDRELDAVVDYIKSHSESQYNQSVIDDVNKNAVKTGNKGPASVDSDPTDAEQMGDELLPDAVDVILETGQASVSMLQRRLKLGYARAARIVDEMEQIGVVGPFQGSKPREVLVTKEQWAAMRNGRSAQMSFDDEEDIETADLETE